MARLLERITASAIIDLSCPACDARQARLEQVFPVTATEERDDGVRVTVAIGPAKTPLRIVCCGCGRDVRFDQQLTLTPFEAS